MQLPRWAEVVKAYKPYCENRAKPVQYGNNNKYPTDKGKQPGWASDTKETRGARGSEGTRSIQSREIARFQRDWIYYHYHNNHIHPCVDASINPKMVDWDSIDFSHPCASILPYITPSVSSNVDMLRMVCPLLCLFRSDSSLALSLFSTRLISLIGVPRHLDKPVVYEFLLITCQCVRVCVYGGG